MQWHVGNAVRDGANSRGWFVGPFLTRDAGIRASGDLEIKWAKHRAHDRRAHVVTGETRTTVLILVEGKCRVELSTGSFVLSEPGDYATWGPAIDHTWEIIDDSTIITVRWWSSSPADPDVAVPPGIGAEARGPKIQRLRL